MGGEREVWERGECGRRRRRRRRRWRLRWRKVWSRLECTVLV